jgi:hypothetical protein
MPRTGARCMASQASGLCSRASSSTRPWAPWSPGSDAKRTRAKRIGAFHGGGNLVVVVLFALSLFSLWSRPGYLPDVLPMVFGLAGVGVALVTAWLGGELVFRLRVGVDDDANLDAANSITPRRRRQSRGLR